MFLHHDNRKGSPRGSSKKEDVLDTMLGLKPCGFEDGASIFELTFTKHRRFFGDDAATRRLSLSTAAGTAEWAVVDPPPSQLDIIQKMLADGSSQKSIAEKLGLTPGRISQILNECKKPPPDPI